MYVDKYFKVNNSIKTSNGWIRKGVTLYCYHKSNNEYYFKNILTASLAVILKEKDIKCDLEVINSVDKLSLFLIHNKCILNAVLPYYDYLPTVGKQVIDDLKEGYITKAYNTIENHIDVIRHSYLGEELRLHCISL